ncbi:Uncharacterised protein [Serratia fonticola]|jgi:RAQPRD family integrative conjugative element protein|nr:Uncharacterised protein [Serratia fonticola]CAI1748429.1 Uncharacterised protein [Serratia fonticola]CAI1781711.1 Uncharacterised protein [Serratia fonticola]
MHKTLLRTLCLAGGLPTVLSVHSAEKDELALVMRQLNQVQASLERACVTQWFLSGI